MVALIWCFAPFPRTAEGGCKQGLLQWKQKLKLLYPVMLGNKPGAQWAHRYTEIGALCVQLIGPRSIVTSPNTWSNFTLMHSWCFPTRNFSHQNHQLPTFEPKGFFKALVHSLVGVAVKEIIINTTQPREFLKDEAFSWNISKLTENSLSV